MGSTNLPGITEWFSGLGWPVGQRPLIDGDMKRVIDQARPIRRISR